MRTLSIITLLALLVIPPVAFAEVQTFTATHTYILGDHDSKDDARQRCLLEAKRNVLEQAGVYIESASEVKNFDLTKDKITSFAAAVMQVTDTKEEVNFQQGHMSLTLTITAQVDLEEVRKQLAGRQGDADVRDSVAAQQERLKHLEAQFEAMQRQQGGQSFEDTPASPQFKIDLRAKAAQGDAHAQSLLGFVYQIGNSSHGFPQDYAQAKYWYEKAAAQGDARAQVSLGMLYHRGQGVPQDYVTARQWFEQASAQGFAIAQYNLGMMYDNGWGVPRDDAKARQWFEQAAAQGYADAQYQLGELLRGRGVSKEARQWYEQAAVQGHAKAQWNLGRLYESGFGGPRDYAQARQWYQKAAAQGDALGQVFLGLLYANGRGVTQDYVQARHWYEKAAAQGDTAAQEYLGLLYAKGDGVLQDYAKAREWWQQAAAQGDAFAQVWLGQLYENGRGIPKDNVRAYMWYNLAVESYMGSLGSFSDPRDKKDIKELVKPFSDDRDKVARRMTPAQIAEAQRLSQQCQAQGLKGC